VVPCINNDRDMRTSLAFVFEFTFKSGLLADLVTRSASG
jgi:hypothetical protein